MLISYMKSFKDIAPRVLSVLLGLLFVVSAVLKIVSIDRFEIYIYSYHFFSLNFSFLVARAAIILELVLGIGLILNFLHKWVWWGNVLMLLGYTFLLVYAQILGRTDNCHCFGDFLQMNPWQSIIKNVALLALLALVYKTKESNCNYQWISMFGVAVASSVAVFCISPPDNFTPNYQPTANLQHELFYESLEQAPLDSLQLVEGKQVVGIFSTGCEYCQMSAHKLALMQAHYGFPKERIHFLFMGSEEGLTKFYEKAEIEPYPSLLYPDAVKLLRMTNGIFPVIVMMENGKVVHEYEFRNMKEDEIAAFFKAE